MATYFFQNSPICYYLVQRSSRGLNESVFAIYFRKILQNTASMSNSKDMSVLVRKKAMALTFSWSNEAQYICAKVTTTLQNGWILQSGGVASGRVCAYHLHSRLVFIEPAPSPGQSISCNVSLFVIVCVFVSPPWQATLCQSLNLTTQMI